MTPESPGDQPSQTAPPQSALAPSAEVGVEKLPNTHSSTRKVFLLALMPLALAMAIGYAFLTAPNLTASRLHYIAATGIAVSEGSSHSNYGSTVSSTIKFHTHDGKTVQGKYQSNFIIPPAQPKVASIVHIYYNPNKPSTIYLRESPIKIALGIVIVSIIAYAILFIIVFKFIQ